MNPFTYVRPGDEAAALTAFAAAPNASYLGGGTNLVDLMKLRVARPERLVDVARLPTDRIELLPDGGILIGGAVRNSVLAADRTIRERYPVLAQALLSAASPQLRNLATTAGNLLQRTRCAYFQDASKPCNKRDPGSGCPALSGHNRNLAILGASQACVATHPSDMAVALVALDATVRIVSGAGARSVPLTEFYRLPGDEPQRETVLEPGDLITHVDVPPLGFAAVSKYRKARDRASYAFALVSLAAALDVADGIVRDVRLAFGGVAHKPWRATRAEAVLRGAVASEEMFRRAADAELAGARPLAQNGFKIPLARNILVRTLLDLAGQA